MNSIPNSYELDRSAVSSSGSRTNWRRPAYVFGGLGLIALVAASLTGPSDWFILGWLCFCTLIYAVTLMYWILSSNPKAILTDPYLILVGAFSLYFIFGPLVLVIGPEAQADYVLQWYPSPASAVVQITAMNLIGLGILLFSGEFLPGWRIERAVQPAATLMGKLSIEKIFWASLVVGVGARVFSVNVDISGTGDVIVLGFIRTLGGLTQFVIFLGLLYRGSSAINLVALAVAAFEISIGLLLFNKLSALMPLAISLLGLYLRRPNLKLATISVVAVVLVFLAIERPVGDARLLLAGTEDKSLYTRFQILSEVSNPDYGHTDSTSGAWSRLCYAVAQVAAVDLYDHNQGGDDIELVGWVFVPRAVFPSKPIITRSGTDFNAKITGTDSSSSGMGLFISGYYNIGWFGLVSVSILAGWILASFAAVSRAVVASGSLIMLPIGLMGSFMAFRIDGHFIADYLGPFGMMMAPFMVFLFILRLTASSAVPRRYQ